ncbi:MAG: carboxypeptidase regulatory-like domain-containing protein [Terracidiphilus sp.]|nr:carboxypeptidase regulatory-like domain-containing protein [Terracidiphilus sp.]
MTRKCNPIKLLAMVSLWALLTSGLCVQAQQETRATLGGRVTDANGSVVASAAVMVAADDTGTTRTAQTNATGNWTVPLLNPGKYHFEVSAPGFRTAVQSGIVLQIADQKFIDTKLEVGADTQNVVVEATAPLIDTSSAMSGATISENALQELPSQSNAPTTLVTMTPGAVVSNGVNGGVFLWSSTGLSSSVINSAGSGSGAINYTIDGGNVSNNAGNLAYEPPMDAVSEVRVITNAYDSMIGRQSAATINMQMKSGKNAYHGDIYEQNMNTFLSANRYENKNAHPVTKLAAMHINQYGGSFGGPLMAPKLYDGRKYKTYFYYGYSGIRNMQPAKTGYASIPTLKERVGDFTESYTTQTVNGVTKTYPIKIYNPYTWNYDGAGNRQPYSTGVIANVNAAAKNYLALLPPPNSASDGTSSNSHNYLRTNDNQSDHFMGNTLRLDQEWNSNNHSYLDLRNNGYDELSTDTFGPSNVLQGLFQTRTNKGVTIDHTSVLRSNLVLDLRYTFTRWTNTSQNSSAGIDPTSFGFSKRFASLMQVPSLPEVTGIGSNDLNYLGTSGAKSYNYDTNQDYNVYFTQILNKHNFKYGLEFMTQQEASGGYGASGGNFDFGSEWTTQNPDVSAGTGIGSPIASMMLGLPTSGTLPNNTSAFWSQHYMALFFQDDWRVTSKLTINAGLRWDYERPVTERYDRYFSRYDPNVEITPVTQYAQPLYSTQILGGSATNAGINLLQTYRPLASTFVVRGGSLYAGKDNISRSAENTIKKYFQPRLGFAYQLLPNTVIRGGVGRFVQDTFVTGSQSGYSSSSPMNVQNDNWHTVLNTWDNPYPDDSSIVKPLGNSQGILTNVGSTTSFTDPNRGRPYTDTGSLTVQQQVKDFLIEVTGLYNATHGLAMNYNINLPSAAAWYAAYTPTFDATGLPSATVAASTMVSNPFYNAPYITNGTQNNKTVAAYQLLRPNPVAGDINNVRYNGAAYYWALNTKVERRFRDGLGVTQAFAWGKRISESNFIGNQIVLTKIERRLDNNDIKFNYTLTPQYDLPFGIGRRWAGHVNKITDELIGGWSLSGQYQFNSGTPLVMPTNSSFFAGGNPSMGSNKNGKQWFDKSKFVMFPTKNTDISAYPSWTGVSNLPGASYKPTSSTASVQNGVYQDFSTWITYNQTTFGNIRNPYMTNLDLGIRKNFSVVKTARLQVRVDMFNALNHARFGNIGLTPGSAGFGTFSGSIDSTKWNQINNPRRVQLAAKLYF